MKGFSKLVKRTPHMMSSKVGLAATSTDADFEILKSRFKAMEKLVQQLVRETQTYLDAARGAW